MKHTFKLSSLVALPLALGVVACSTTRVETDPEPVTVSTTSQTDTLVVRTDTSMGNPVDTTTVVVTTPDASGNTSGYQASGVGGMTQSLALKPVNGSNFTGNAVLTDLGGGKTRIALTLNAPANTDASIDHDANIHSGTCAAPGPVVHELDDVDANGSASDTEVDASMSVLMDGNHIVAAEENDGERAVACAEITSHSGM